MDYRNRAAAPAHLRTKTELKEARLKPAEGQQPVAAYWQGHGYVSLYDPAHAVPMRPRRAVSPAQAAALAAGRALVGTALCAGCGQRTDKCWLDQGGRCDTCIAAAEREEWEQERRAVGAEAARWLSIEPVFWDTETTGLDDQAEIIEIAIVDRSGAILLDTFVKPSQPISLEASAVNGVRDEDVARAPCWSDIALQVVELLAGKLAIAHHAAFDDRMLRQTCARYGVRCPDIRSACTMELLTTLNAGRWPGLIAAAGISGADVGLGRLHRARGDAEMCRRIVLALARRTEA